MKLTAAHIKKLIREELERVNEANFTTSPEDPFSDAERAEIFAIIQNVAKNNNVPEPKRSRIAKLATDEIDSHLSPFSGISGYSLNVSKHRKRSGYPSFREGEISEIIINAARKYIDEASANHLAKIALPLIFKSEAFAEMSRMQGLK